MVPLGVGGGRSHWGFLEVQIGSNTVGGNGAGAVCLLVPNMPVLKTVT